MSNYCPECGNRLDKYLEEYINDIDIPPFFEDGRVHINRRDLPKDLPEMVVVQGERINLHGKIPHIKIVSKHNHIEAFYQEIDNNVIVGAIKKD